MGAVQLLCNGSEAMIPIGNVKLVRHVDVNGTNKIEVLEIKKTFYHKYCEIIGAVTKLGIDRYEITKEYESKARKGDINPRTGQPYTMAEAKQKRLYWIRKGRSKVPVRFQVRSRKEMGDYIALNWLEPNIAKKYHMCGKNVLLLSAFQVRIGFMLEFIGDFMCLGVW